MGKGFLQYESTAGCRRAWFDHEEFMCQGGTSRHPSGGLPAPLCRGQQFGCRTHGQCPKEDLSLHLSQTKSTPQRGTSPGPSMGQSRGLAVAARCPRVPCPCRVFLSLWMRSSCWPLQSASSSRLDPSPVSSGYKPCVESCEGKGQR